MQLVFELGNCHLGGHKCQGISQTIFWCRKITKLCWFVDLIWFDPTVRSHDICVFIWLFLCWHIVMSECNCGMNFYVRLIDSLIGDKGFPFNTAAFLISGCTYENHCRLPMYTFTGPQWLRTSLLWRPLCLWLINVKVPMGQTLFILWHITV